MSNERNETRANTRSRKEEGPSVVCTDVSMCTGGPQKGNKQRGGGRPIRSSGGSKMIHQVPYAFVCAGLARWPAGSSACVCESANTTKKQTKEMGGTAKKEEGGDREALEGATAFPLLFSSFVLTLPSYCRLPLFLSHSLSLLNRSPSATYPYGQTTSAASTCSSTCCT